MKSLNYQIVNTTQHNNLLIDIKHNIRKGKTEYEEVLAWFFERLGVKYFSYVYMEYVPAEVEEAVILGNYPRDWVKSYEASFLFREDPVIHHASTTTSGFFWSEAVDDKASSKRLFDMSSQYGIEKGFTVPLHEPGFAFGSMHFPTSKDNSEFTSIINNYSYLINAVCQMAHQQRPSLARPEQYQRFSLREGECLQWMAMGKTYGEIAIILDISERTVKFHAQNIMNKMKAVNIKQAMTKALRLNLI